jgi:hypothetical protein
VEAVRVGGNGGGGDGKRSDKYNELADHGGKWLG